MSSKNYIRPCTIGGRDLKTGKKTGNRHRWKDGDWTCGKCFYCGKSKKEVTSKRSTDFSPQNDLFERLRKMNFEFTDETS